MNAVIFPTFCVIVPCFFDCSSTPSNPSFYSNGSPLKYFRGWVGVYIHFTRGWSGYFHFMIEIILMTFIWILWTLSSPLTQSNKYRKWKHTSFLIHIRISKYCKIKSEEQCLSIFYWELNQHTQKCRVLRTRNSSSKNIWLAQYSITRAETCFLNWEQEQWVVSRMILEDYIQTPPVLWGVGKRTPYQTSWHVCHY